MVFGLSLAAFTQVHVIISLVGIAAGLIFFAVLVAGRWLGWANALFLVFTILTSATGFLFPPKPIGPPFVFGIISLNVFAIALYALYGRAGAGGWRRVYVASALFAQWLNMVVLVVQGFQKIPALNAFAPTGTEPPFLAAQALVAALLAWFGWKLLRRPAAAPLAAA